MIDTTKKYWTGDSESDIAEYLKLYSQNEVSDTKNVVCSHCGDHDFLISIDDKEGAIEVTCTNCYTKKLLLDSEEYWDKCKPHKGKCTICKNKSYNVMVGFVRREDGNVKWIYIGNRCTKCGTLGSYGDWGINYEPTDMMESNI